MTKVTFPGRYESLAEISRYYIQAGKQAGLSDKAVYAVQTAVDEACTNIIDHAYGGENIGVIECGYEINSNGLIITIQDHGRPFNPEIVPEPDLTSKLENRRERGLGLYFMKRLMDEVQFEFDSDDGNTLRMFKRKEKTT